MVDRYSMRILKNIYGNVQLNELFFKLIFFQNNRIISEAGYDTLLQGFQMGIALPQFLLNIDGASGGILLLWIVGVCILLPLVIAVVYLSRSSKYTGNYVMHQTLSTYYFFTKPSLAPRYDVYSSYQASIILLLFEFAHCIKHMVRCSQLHMYGILINGMNLGVGLIMGLRFR